MADPDLALLVFWVVATDPKAAQTWVGALLSQPRSYSSAPAGSTGEREGAGAPFAAPHAVPKKLNKDFSFRGCQSGIITGTHSFLAVTHLSLSHRQINNRGSKAGTKHWHAKKTTLTSHPSHPYMNLVIVET